MTPINLYDGSTIFQPLSDMSGFSIDKVEFSETWATKPTIIL